MIQKWDGENWKYFCYTLYRTIGSSSCGIIMAISSGTTRGSLIIHGLCRDENNSVIASGSVLVDFIGFCSLCALCASINTRDKNLWVFEKSCSWQTCLEFSQFDWVLNWLIDIELVHRLQSIQTIRCNSNGVLIHLPTVRQIRLHSLTDSKDH